jgi:hypothetical protein
MATTLVACGGESEPFYPPPLDSAPAMTGYDPDLEPSAGVLPFVPNAATSVEITDFVQMRLSLGLGEIDGRSPARERNEFWSRADRTAALSGGLLRPHEERLRDDFSLGQDDIIWEAHWSNADSAGWVVAFRPDLAPRRIRRAINAEVGPLAGAVLDSEHNLVSSGAAPALEESWARDEEVVAVAGRQAISTLIQRGCIELADIYGAATIDRLDGQVARDVTNLDELTVYAVALGTELATARLGPARDDAFMRLRLASHLPQLEPEFGSVFTGGVANPSAGELGFRTPRPARAATWVTERRLPFAACG